jgi:hypothetical protein
MSSWVGPAGRPRTSDSPSTDSTVSSALIPSTARRAPSGRNPVPAAAPAARPVRATPAALNALTVVVVRLTTLGSDGPTGGFLSEDGPMPW